MKKYLVVAIVSTLMTSAVFWFFHTYHEVRRVSKLKMVVGNLRQLASAADQYFLENKAESVTYKKLIEDEYFWELHSAFGENYQMTIRVSDDEICVRIPDGFYSVCISF